MRIGRGIRAGQPVLCIPILSARVTTKKDELTLSIERIPLQRAWLTMPKSVVLRDSIDASTDV